MSELPVPVPGDRAPAPAGGFMQQSWSSIPTDTPEGKRLLAKVLTAESIVLWDRTPVTIDVEHLSFKTTVIDDMGTGAPRDAVMCLITATDGRTYHTVSKTCIEDLSAFASAFGMPPWTGGLKIRFERRTTKSRRPTLRCTLADDGDSAGGTAT